MEAAAEGSWVVLQNCHLAENWMERLVQVLEDNLYEDEDAIHDSFRLWLTCYSSPNFPPDILRDAVKVRDQHHTASKIFEPKILKKKFIGKNDRKMPLWQILLHP